jgi:hypothetical protein
MQPGQTLGRRKFGRRQHPGEGDVTDAQALGARLGRRGVEKHVLRAGGAQTVDGRRGDLPRGHGLLDRDEDRHRARLRAGRIARR